MILNTVWSERGHISLAGEKYAPILLDDEGRWHEVPLTREDNRNDQKYELRTRGCTVYFQGDHLVQAWTKAGQAWLPYHKTSHILPTIPPLSDDVRGNILDEMCYRMHIRNPRGDDPWTILLAAGFREEEGCIHVTANNQEYYPLLDACIAYGLHIGMTYGDVIFRVTISRERQPCAVVAGTNRDRLYMFWVQEAPVSGRIITAPGLAVRVEGRYV